MERRYFGEAITLYSGDSLTNITAADGTEYCVIKYASYCKNTEFLKLHRGHMTYYFFEPDDSLRKELLK